MFSRTAGILCSAVASTAFVGYCIYFDHKRRNDPQFRTKLRERRQQAAAMLGHFAWPNLTNPEDVKQFFLFQIEKGDQLVTEGQIEEGTDYMARAIAVSGQPQSLLQSMQFGLPPEAFSMLVNKLPKVGKELMREMHRNKLSPQVVEEKIAAEERQKTLEDELELD